MERACFYLRILPGKEAEYDRRHAAPWPDVAEAIHAAGLRNMTGFRRGTDVWYVQEVEPDRKTGFDVLGTAPANQRWNDSFRDVIAQITDESGGLLWYDEVFHVGGSPSDGPFQRALTSLVIKPERAVDFDALHASAWPDLIEAAQSSGVCNYTGFRRGPHVVFYGEYFPDMKTAIAKFTMNAATVRWTRALEGLISMVTDIDGGPVTAREVFHQD